MENLVSTILSLENISKDLEPGEPVRNKYLSQVQDFVNSFINGIDKAVDILNQARLKLTSQT